jgi:hypothetical protein
VYYRLSAVTEGQFSYGYYGVRHPGAIPSIHFSEVLTAFNSLARAVANSQARRDPCSEEEIKALVNLTEGFLFRLINYFEGGHEIFLCFCDQLEKPSPRRPLQRWLNEKGYQPDVESYFLQTAPDLERYRNFFNALKHSSNRTIIFQFLNRQKPMKALGFYLEGVDETGAIGPIMDLHATYQDSPTAWSYNLHLRNFYFLIYKIAAEMDTVTQRLCLRAGTPLPPPNTPLVSIGIETIAGTAVTETVSRFETSFITFYPQEAEEKVKSVSIDPSDGVMAFSDCLGGERALSPRQGSGVIMTSRGDRFSRTWKLPYFKQQG